jgi:hypothetical protein
MSAIDATKAAAHSESGARYRRVEGRTSNGHRYWYWSRDVPPIPNQYLDSVVFLYPDVAAAERRADSGGSGFIASWPDGAKDPAFRSLYIVTNRHVAEKAHAVRLEKSWGRGADVLATPYEGWWHHPDGDDVSVFPLELSFEQQFYYSAIPFTRFMHQGSKETGWLGPGEDVFLLGRHIDRKGFQVDSPIARFGHIAAPPLMVRNDLRGLDQLSYLVEVLSRSGYSGSPAIVFRLQLEIPHVGGPQLSIGEPRPRAKSQAGTPGEPVLLGINWGHLHESVPVYQPGGERAAEKFYVQQNTGLAAVVPAWRITEILENEDLAETREEGRKRRKREAAELWGTTED